MHLTHQGKKRDPAGSVILAVAEQSAQIDFISSPAQKDQSRVSESPKRMWKTAKGPEECEKEGYTHLMYGWVSLLKEHQTIKLDDILGVSKYDQDVQQQ